MGFDAHRARALGFGERLTGELRDRLGIDAQRFAEQTLREDTREVDGAIDLRLRGTFFAST